MSRHLPTRRRFVHQTTISSSQVFLSHLRNRGNKDLSKRSNCSVLQGIRVGSAEEHNQYIPIPQRVSQQASALSLSKTILSNPRKLGILPQISTFSSSIYIYILNKHPRQSWSRDCSPAVYQQNHFPSNSNFPRRVQPRFPRKVGIHIPRQ